MFEPNKKRFSEVPFEIVPEQMQQEIWHMIFMRPQKGTPLTSPQRFHFFKNKMERTLSVVYSQADPYFSDNITAPYIEAYEDISFPSILYVYDKGSELWMSLQ
ncbi:DUF960 family protein [Enterococcus hermanniensis]|uniref:Uncharacterized protein n=1 Tax=Enterococcus hermanniensis TaxID=249189 RepID=A0A1L8TLU9_9ENTE|nr:DUF960 family protein [Enterococcus hermanniensis]OJG45267.1 hypothetical protein RV04_GL002315 [Enterococcus hermanniensis]